MATQAIDRSQIALEEIPLLDIIDVRRWLLNNGPNPAHLIADPILSQAAAEHMTTVQWAFQSPIHFALALGLEVYDQQVTTAHAILDHERVAIRGCHSSGKTFMVLVFAIWWMLSHEQAMILTTAPTEDQIKTVMWTVIRSLAEIVERKLRLKMPKPDKMQWEIEPRCSMEGRSTNKAVNFQGYHSDNMLMIIDEAPGLEEDLWGAIDGITASGHIRIVMLGNPTISSGMFYDACLHMGDWYSIRYSALRDNPNILGLPISEWTEPVQPPREDMSDEEIGRLATLLQMEEDDPELDNNVTQHMTMRRWIRNRWLSWGAKGLPDWWGRVLGQFPPGDEHSMFTRDALDRVYNHHDTTLADAKEIEWGVDPSGEGQNDTAVTAREGDRVASNLVHQRQGPASGRCRPDHAPSRPDGRCSGGQCGSRGRILEGFGARIRKIHGKSHHFGRKCGPIVA